MQWTLIQRRYLTFIVSTDIFSTFLIERKKLSHWSWHDESVLQYFFAPHNEWIFQKKKSTNQIHDQTAFHLSHLFTTFILACFDFLEKHSGGMKKERSKMKMVPLCNRKFTSLFAELEEFLRVRDYGFDSSQKLLKIWVFYFKQTQFTLKISNMTLPIEIYIFICMPFTLTSVEWISFNFHSSASPK